MSRIESIGDLAVSVEQLRSVPRPAYVASRMQTFSLWFELGERLFEQSLSVLLELGIYRPTPAEVEDLHRAAEGNSLFIDLMEQSSVAFEYIGYEYGHLYGGANWRKLCLWRSAAATFEQLGLTFDLSETDAGLERWGHELFEQLEVPKGIPESHWWWFRAAK